MGEFVNDISLKLQNRVADGKKVKKLRESGLVPSVIYGGDGEPILTQSPTMETTRVVRVAGKHTPVSLILNDHKKLAIIKTIDFNPVDHILRHVAFHAIKQDDVITTEVPIVLIGEGESPAERAGLVVLQAIEKIEIKAKPADLPQSLGLSVEGLVAVDDRLTVADIKLPKGVEFSDNEQDMELVIANVYEPSALQAANEAAGGDSETDGIEPETTETPVAKTEEVKADEAASKK